MRVKQLRLIVTFPTTTAMAMEKVCAARRARRLIPVPREITAAAAWRGARRRTRGMNEKAAREAVSKQTDGMS